MSPIIKDEAAGRIGGRIQQQHDLWQNLGPEYTVARKGDRWQFNGPANLKLVGFNRAKKHMETLGIVVKDTPTPVKPTKSTKAQEPEPEAGAGAGIEAGAGSQDDTEEGIADVPAEVQEPKPVPTPTPSNTNIEKFKEKWISAGEGFRVVKQGEKYQYISPTNEKFNVRSKAQDYLKAHKASEVLANGPSTTAGVKRPRSELSDLSTQCLDLIGSTWELVGTTTNLVRLIPVDTPTHATQNEFIIAGIKQKIGTALQELRDLVPCDSSKARINLPANNTIISQLTNIIQDHELRTGASARHSVPSPTGALDGKADTKAATMELGKDGLPKQMRLTWSNVWVRLLIMEIKDNIMIIQLREKFGVTANQLKVGKLVSQRNSAAVVQLQVDYMKFLEILKEEGRATGAISLRDIKDSRFKELLEAYENEEGVSRAAAFDGIELCYETALNEAVEKAQQEREKKDHA